MGTNGLSSRIQAPNNSRTDRSGMQGQIVSTLIKRAKLYSQDLSARWGAHKMCYGSFDMILHECAEKGIVRILVFAADNGANVNSQDKLGKTALIKAVKIGHFPTIKVLLRYGANVNLGSYDGCTALMEAAKSKNETIVRMLLNYGAEVNCQNSTGWTALHYAALYGNEAVARKLIEHGADTKLTNTWGKNALKVSVGQFGHRFSEYPEALVKLLIIHEESQEFLDDAMSEAVRNRWTDIVKMLIDKGANVHYRLHRGHTLRCWP